MAEQDARKLVVIDFDEPMRAQEFLLAATGLVKSGELALHDAVFVSRTPEGHSTVHETTDVTPGRGALGGAVWGVLIGTLLGGPLGALVGGAASAGGGALLAKLIDTGIKDEQVRQLRDTVRPGTTALALLVSHVSLPALRQELARFPSATIMQSDLPTASLHAVRDALDDPAIVNDPNIRIGLDDEPPTRAGVVRHPSDEPMPTSDAPAPPPADATADATPGAEEPGTSAPPADPNIRIGLDDDPPPRHPGPSDPTAPPT